MVIPSTKSPLEIWWLAIRPRTLPAAAAPVIVGSALAFYDGAFQFFPALAALLGALLLQIGANLEISKQWQLVLDAGADFDGGYFIVAGPTYRF